VAEALGAAAPHRVIELFVTESAATREPQLLARATSEGVAVHWVSDRVIATLDTTVTSQGVVGVAAIPSYQADDLLAADPQLVAVLAGVAEPGNAGTVIRTADAAGADLVLMTVGSADVYAGKVVRASAGSLFHLPVVTGLDPVGLGHRLAAVGLAVLAAVADGEAELTRLAADGSLERPTAWLFGNEAHGLTAEVAGDAHHRVRIPMHPRAESLNLAAAAAICLFASSAAQPARGAARR
jgi:TrmH family RNA methyltransferase